MDDLDDMDDFDMFDILGRPVPPPPLRLATHRNRANHFVELSEREFKRTYRFSKVVAE